MRRPCCATRLGFAHLTAAMLAGGCTGSVEAPEQFALDPEVPGPHDDSVEPGASPGEEVGAPVGGPTLPARLWRLAPVELRATTEAALGVGLLEDDAFTTDAVDDYANQASRNAFHPDTLDPLEVVVEHAELAAAAYVADPSAPCLLEDAPAESCFAEFFETAGRTLFRRPLTSEEQASYRALWTEAYAAIGAADATEVLIAALLLSPEFLYRKEVPTEGNELRGYALAEAISYALTGSPPDDVLFELAASGDLERPAVRRDEAVRLLRSDRGLAHLDRFFVEYLQIQALTAGANAKNDAGYTPELQRALAAETRAFVRRTLAEDDGSLRTLLTSSESLLTPLLAEFYNVSGNGWTTFPPHVRSGVLTHAGVIGSHTRTDRGDPIHRGLWIRERVLCNPVLPPDIPPDDLVAQLPEYPDNATRREEFEIFKDALPACAGCHSAFEPIGLSFEHYDGLGRYREAEFDQVIDAHVELPDGARVESAAELGAWVAESPQAQTCFAQNLLTFLVGESAEEQEAWKGAIVEGLVRADLSVFAAVAEAVAHPHFVQRARR